MKNLQTISKKNYKLSLIMRFYPVLFLLLLLILNILFILPLFLIYIPYRFNNCEIVSFYNKRVDMNYVQAYIEERNMGIDLIYFGGNATNLRELNYMSSIMRQSGCNLIYPVYKGFGSSTDSCNEMELMIQVHALVDFIKSRGNKVFILGFSLGAAITLYYNKVYGGVDKIILVNSFYSMDSVIEAMFPMFSFIRYFITEKYENYERAKFCNINVIFAAGESDTMISCKNTMHLNRIYTGVNGLPKDYNLRIFPGHNHNSLIAISNEEFMELFRNYFMNI